MATATTETTPNQEPIEEVLAELRILTDKLTGKGLRPEDIVPLQQALEYLEKVDQDFTEKPEKMKFFDVLAEFRATLVLLVAIGAVALSDYGDTQLKPFEALGILATVILTLVFEIIKAERRKEDVGLTVETASKIRGKLGKFAQRLRD